MMLSHYLYANESEIVDALVKALPWDGARAKHVEREAHKLVESMRAHKYKFGEFEVFFKEYGLNTAEGLALLTLAEALLRIPDARTANALIKDKVTAAEWYDPDNDKDLLIRLSELGLRITGGTLNSVFSRLGEPVIRAATTRAMRILGQHFVLGRTIEEGVQKGAPYEDRGFRMSYDMLGEGARTMEDADRYYESYEHAIEHTANTAREGVKRPGISIKLSALYPRYEYAQADRCIPALSDRLGTLARRAADRDLSMIVDAEEVDRLELSLQILQNVVNDKALKGWDGLGFVVQAYQKRAYPLIDHLADMHKQAGRKLVLRLVKGAYWDSEVKRAQVQGLPDYPVFTRKSNTDLSYLACADKILRQQDVFTPLFGTHNAHTTVSIMELAKEHKASFEFQQLHSMAYTLNNILVEMEGVHTGIYAPCGRHVELLPYLVRRLLENGASTSFLFKIFDKDIPIEEIIGDPVRDARDHAARYHPKIALPCDIYGAARKNSEGLDLTEASSVEPLIASMKEAVKGEFVAAPLVGGKTHKTGSKEDCINPADTSDVIGTVYNANPELIDLAFKTARKGFKAWRSTLADNRARVLETLADLMEDHRDTLMGLCVREAGKTIPDALAEIREAVDFCRYYAQQGRELFSEDGEVMPGPTGESNILTLHGRGTFICISPWNFPLAIFTGQVVAALMAGNAVIAKPAGQTPLIAAHVGQLLLKAGLPSDVFALLPGGGIQVGAALVNHKDVAGVAFTGSTAVAKGIQRDLASKDGPIVPLIAETGGQNAMIVDSSALLEQVVDDVILSAFGSAGQRCSALRVLYIQDEIADNFITMLKGAMKERRVGNPFELSSDVGPVIDDAALQVLKAHRDRMSVETELIDVVHVDQDVLNSGHFFAPVAFEIPSITVLQKEVFGPVLHVIRYRADKFDDIVEEINSTGYGLTFGLHTRLDTRMKTVARAVDVGNVYINRSMTGAVVGVQPFGGQGLSGTGPKAGGPHYLPQFATEKTISIDTTRQGGNASLVSMEET